MITTGIQLWYNMVQYKTVKNKGGLAMMNLLPGTVEELLVDRQTDFGYFLTNRVEDVLLPNREVEGEIEIGDWVDVFLYHDKLGRITATMKIPAITEDVYGWAEVVGKQKDLGVFVNIGLSKDILVSKDELPLFTELWPNTGDQLFVTLKRDRKDRLFAHLASEDTILSNLGKKPKEKLFNATLSGRVYKLKKVGTYVITDEGYKIFIHESERPEEPRLGEKISVRIIDLKDDGSLNGSLLPFSKDKIDDDAEVVLTYLIGRGGAMPYGDKSDPEIIKDFFNMSKGSFKKALGKLMKENKIYQEDGWTYTSDRK